jgi:hypothetical protein
VVTSGPVQGFLIAPEHTATVAVWARAAMAARARNGQATSAGERALIDEITAAAGEFSRPVSAYGSKVGSVTEMRPALTQDISTDTASMLLGVTASRVRQLLRDGELEGQLTEGRWRTTRQAVTDYQRELRKAS